MIVDDAELQERLRVRAGEFGAELDVENPWPEEWRASFRELRRPYVVIQSATGPTKRIALENLLLAIGG